MCRDLAENVCFENIRKMKNVITGHIFELRIFGPASQAGNFVIYNFEKIQTGVEI